MVTVPQPTITITNKIKISTLRKLAKSGGMKVGKDFALIVTSPKFINHITGLMITTWDLANEEDRDLGEHLFEGFLEYDG